MLSRCLTFCCVLLFGVLHAEPPRLIKIGGAPLPPLVFTNEQGKVDGVIPQLMDEIAKNNHWHIEWVMDSWANQLGRLERNELDIMSAIGHSDERERIYDFSEQSVLSVWGQLYTQEGLVIRNFLELDNKEIAVLKDGISGQRFQELCVSFAVRCIISQKDSFEEVFKAIDRKEVIGGIVNSHYGFVNEPSFRVNRSDVMFSPFQVLFATTKGKNNELLQVIDRQMADWKSDNESVYFQITDRWINRETKQEFPSWIVYSLAVLLGSTLIFSLITLFLRREVKRRTQQVSMSEAQLSQIINVVPHVIFATDANGKVILANREATKIFNKNNKDIKNVTRAQLMVQQPSLEPLLCDDEKVMGRQGEQMDQEIEMLCDNKYLRYFQMAKVPFVRKSTHLPAVVTIAVDITEQKHNTAQIEHLANHDELTGLPNRAMFFDRLGQAVALSKRYQRTGTVLFIDVDLFKSINDTLGHAVGDVLLQLISARIQKHCRESDTVARFGGDEFIVLLNELGSSFEEASNNAIAIVKKIRNEITKDAKIGRHDISISVSQGLAFFPHDGEKQEQLIQRADMAMYHAKSLGRNKIVSFHPSMEKSIKRKEKLKKDLRVALKENELFLVYQPQIDSRTQSCRGVEALLRWNHHREHIIYPLEFIPIAEESGIIVELGDFVLRESCEQLSKWRAQFQDDFYVTVNISARQIASKHLVKYINSLMEEFQLPWNAIELEVTESMLMMDMERAVKVLKKLKSKGVKISLDDFGTGYSSLSYLKKLPLDKLKIDKSFVNDIPGDRDSEAIAKTIISMANELELEVVAEGVESHSQVNFFQQHGCYLFQGFYFAAPTRAPEMTRQFFTVVDSVQSKGKS